MNASLHRSYFVRYRFTRHDNTDCLLDIDMYALRSNAVSLHSETIAISKS